MDDQDALRAQALLRHLLSVSFCLQIVIIYQISNVVRFRLANIERDVDHAWNLSDYTQRECREEFRFDSPVDIRRVAAALGIPRLFYSKSGDKVSGEQALCMVLYKFAFPHRHSLVFVLLKLHAITLMVGAGASGRSSGDLEEPGPAVELSKI